MRVCMRVCMEIGIRTHDQDQDQGHDQDHDQHTTGHGTPPEKRGTRASRPEWCKCSGHLKGLQAAPEAKQESNKQIFALYIGIEKYLQKKLKKFASIEICCNFVAVIKQQTTL